MGISDQFLDIVVATAALHVVAVTGCPAEVALNAVRSVASWKLNGRYVDAELVMELAGEAVESVRFPDRISIRFE